jgi:peptidoglycan/xylan/chitin deacetylase (PgdA/CDA1 family)
MEFQLIGTQLAADPTFLFIFAKKRMKWYPIWWACLLYSFLVACNSNPSAPTPAAIKDSPQSRARDTGVTREASLLAGPVHAQEVLARKQIPILCYHQIREWKPTDSKTAKDYIVPPTNFRDQINMLAQLGYHCILPDQLLAYLAHGARLPDKPIMLTFDDTDLDQWIIARTELDKHGFKAVYFIMTVSLGKTHYMSREQVKELSDQGNVIGSHTWDHHNVKKYQGADWAIQIDKPTKELETITGKPIHYFAYPFGLWNKAAIEELKKRGFVAAFQLIEKRDEQDPLFTIRRMIVPGSWSPTTLEHAIEKNF